MVISLAPKCVTEIDILCSSLTPSIGPEPEEVRVIQEARNSQVEISETVPSPQPNSKSKTILHPREMTGRERMFGLSLHFLLRSICFLARSL